MAAPLLVLDRVRKVYSRGRIVRRPTFTLEADLVIDRPAIVGVVGPNGAGKTTLFEMMTGSNAPSAGHVYVAGTDIHRVKYRERDRLAIHYHQSYQVRRFRKLVPSALLAHSPTTAPMVHLFDEPQFNLQDGYIGFMLDFFRKLRTEGRLVVLCLHPTATWHLEILAEIAEQFLLVSNGGVTRYPDFPALVQEPRFRSYLGPELTQAAESALGLLRHCEERSDEAIQLRDGITDATPSSTSPPAHPSSASRRAQLPRSATGRARCRGAGGRSCRAACGCRPVVPLLDQAHDPARKGCGIVTSRLGRPGYSTKSQSSQLSLCLSRKGSRGR